MVLINYFFIIFLFFWLIREIKAILFWLYLWQLKEYQIKRFFDHFRTENGKKIFFNWFFLLKLFLLSWALFLFFYKKLLPGYFYSSWVIILLLFYILEGIKFLVEIFLKKIKKPVLTKKTAIILFLNFISLFFLIIFLNKIKNFLYWIALIVLLFDIFSPLFVSIIVLFFQPWVFLWRKKIAKMAKEKREKFKDLIVIAICGSFGKTSTKEFLAKILSEKFKVLKTKEHINAEIGIAQTILNELKDDHQIFIAEIGAYRKGKVKEVCDFLEPKIGIITGVNEQHLSLFGTMANLLSAEGGGELIASLPSDGTIFLNGKNEICRKIFDEIKIKKYLYGQNAALLEENLEGAKMVAKELGMTEKEIEKALEKIENKLPGFEIKKGVWGINFIDATYSANPDGVLAHLEYLKNFSGRKVIIMPCLIELGKASKEVHQRIGKKIAEVCDLAIITTKERFKEIKEEARDKAVFLEKPEEIFEKIKNFSKEEDVILLEGRIPSSLLSLLIPTIKNQ